MTPKVTPKAPPKVTPAVRVLKVLSCGLVYLTDGKRLLVSKLSELWKFGKGHKFAAEVIKKVRCSSGRQASCSEGTAKRWG